MAVRKWVSLTVGRQVIERAAFQQKNLVLLGDAEHRWETDTPGGNAYREATGLDVLPDIIQYNLIPLLDLAVLSLPLKPTW